MLEKPARYLAMITLAGFAMSAWAENIQLFDATPITDTKTTSPNGVSTASIDRAYEL